MDFRVKYVTNLFFIAIIFSSFSRKSLKLLSWNIDGIDDSELYMRTVGACQEILKHEPDIVFLQEVTEETLPTIKKLCHSYGCCHFALVGYFCAILWKRNIVKKTVEPQILRFPASQMGRYLMTIEMNFNGIPLVLMTTHLESTKMCMEARKRQLRVSLKEIVEQSAESNVILAGDLNLRDEELADVGGLPAGVHDAWEITGSDSVNRYTWDVSENDNLNWKYKSKPKCRFDRVFYRPAKTDGVVAEKFRLIGKERLESCGRFPSDHWGILCEFRTRDKEN